MKNINSSRAVRAKLVSKLSLFAAALALLGVQPAHASNATWVNTGSSASWGDPTNWGGTAPGNTTAGGTATTDVATFNTAIGVNGFGSAATPITIDSGRTILGMTFATGAGNYFIGTTGGNPLYLSSGGTIQESSGAEVVTINAPLVIAGGAGNSYTFASNGTGSMNFGGTITSAATSGTTTLNINGGSTINSIISGVISNGTGTNAVAVSHSGSGRWTLSGANTYSGGTTQSAGVLDVGNNSALGTGTLTVTGGAVGASVSGVTLANNISLVGTTFFVGQAGSSDVTNNITFTGTFGGNGTSTTIDNEESTGIVTFSGGHINISPGAAASTLTLNNQFGSGGAVTTISSVIQNGGAGAGALVVGASDVGVLTVNLNGANTYTGGTTLSLANFGVLNVGNNSALGTGALKITAGELGASVSGVTLANAIQLNNTSLVFGQNGTSDLTNSLTLTGAITTTATSTTIDNQLSTGVATISGSTISISPAGTASTLTINNSAGVSGSVLNISSVIQNGGSGAGSVVYGTSDTGTPIYNISGANTYTGTTTLSAGVLNVGNNSALSTGALTITGGAIGASVSGTSLANNITISGATMVVGQQGGTDAANNITFTGTVTPTTTATVIDTQLSTGIASFNGSTINIDPSAGTASTLTLNNASGTSGSVFSISSVIQNGGANAGALVVGSTTDVGTLTVNLSGANTYTGSTTVNVGATVNDSGTLASTALVLGGGTFNDTGSTSQTFTTTTLNTGTAGFVGSSSSGTLGLGTITRNSGATLNVTNTGTGHVTAINANVNGILGGWATFGTGTSTVFASSGGNGTLAGNITGVTYSKALPTTGDTVTSDNDSLAVGQSQTAASTINSLTITDTTANDTLALNATPLTFTSGGGLLYNGGSTYNITASSPAGIIGAGAANEFNVNVTSGGTLNISAPVVSTTGTAGSLTVGGGGTLILTSTSSSFTGNTSISPNTTLKINGAGTLGASTYNGAIADNGSLVFNTSANQTLGGAISGLGSLTQSGSGTLFLNGATTFTGPVTFNAGIVNVNSAFASLGTAPSTFVANQFTFNGGELFTNNNAFTISANQGITLLAGGGTILTQQSGSFNILLNSVITGSGSLTVDSSNAAGRNVVFSAANTYTGGTFVTFGLATMGSNSSAFGTGTVTLSNFAGIAINNGATLANNVTVASTGGYIQNQGGTETVSGAINLVGGGGLQLDTTQNSTITNFTGNITGTGNISFFGSTNARGNFQINLNGASINNIGTITDSDNVGGGLSFHYINGVIGSNVTGVIQNAPANSAELILNGANLYTSPTQILSGIINTATLANNGVASGIGVGAATPSAADLVFGAGGGTLQYNANTAQQTTNRLFTIGSTASTTGTEASATIDSSSATAANYVDFDGTGAIAFGATAAGVTSTLTLTGSNTGNNELDPVLGNNATSGTGVTSLVKSGAGTWILGGADTFTGTITISGGTLQIGNGTTGSIATTQTISDAGTLAFDEAAASPETVTNAITGAGGLTQIGGTTILTGAKAYTGLTTVSGGTLQLGNGTTNGTLATTSVITDNGTLIFDENTAVIQGTAFNGAPITGSGNVTVEGAGAVTLNAANAFATLTDAGTVNVATVAASGTAQPLGKGLITLAGTSSTTGVLNYTGAAGSLGNSIAVTAGDQGTIVNNSSTGAMLTLASITVGTTGTAGTLNLTGVGGATYEGQFTVAGQITGSNANSNLNIVDAYALLSSANTYGGATSLYGSGSLGSPGYNVLRAGIAGALPSTTVVTLGNATAEGSSLAYYNILDLNGNNQTIAGLVSSNDTTNGGTSGDYNYVVNGNADYPGSFGLSALTPASSTLTIAPGTGQTYTFGGVLGGGATSNNIAVTIAGPGTEVFTNFNTYTGATSINSGTLSINNVAGVGTAQALGEGSVINLGLGTSSAADLLTYTGGTATLGDSSGTIYVLGTGTNTISNTGTGTLTLADNIVKSGTTFTVTGAVNIAGIISGSAMNSDMDYNNATSTVSVAGTYNGPTRIFNNSTVTSGVNEALPDSTTLTLGDASETANKNNTFALGGFTQTLAGLTSTNGSGHTDTNEVIGGSGTLSTLTLNIASGTNAYAGLLGDGTATTDSNNNLALVKSGGGVLVLSAANTYTGGTTVSGGTLQFSSDSNLGASTGSLALSGGTLEATATTGSTGRTLTLGSGTNNLLVDSGKTYTYTNSGTSKITGTGALNISGPGVFVLNDASNANDFSGGSTLSGGGTTQISDATALGGTSNATTINGATLEVTGTNNSVTTSRSFVLGDGVSGSGTYDVDSSNTYKINSSISGTGTLNSTGPGTLALSSSTGNSYTGGTTVSAGSLLITNTSGSATGNGGLTVALGATFGGAGRSISTTGSFNVGTTGTGMVKSTIQVGNGTDSTSTLALQGTGTNNIENANLTFNLNATAPLVGGVGQSNELLVGNSTVNFSNTNLTLNMGIGVSTATPFILIAGTSSTDQYTGLTFSNTNPNEITGGLTYSFTDPTIQSWYANSYLFLNTSGGVDDIEIEVVPEPSTWALMFGGLAMLIFWQRRKNKHS